MNPMLKKEDLDPRGYGFEMPDEKVIFDPSKFNHCPTCYPRGYIVKDGKEITCPTCNGTTAVSKEGIIVIV